MGGILSETTCIDSARFRGIDRDGILFALWLLFILGLPESIIYDFPFL